MKYMRCTKTSFLMSQNYFYLKNMMLYAEKIIFNYIVDILYYKKLSNNILCCAIDEDQCDIDEETEIVDDPCITIPTPVTMLATRKKKNFS